MEKIRLQKFFTDAGVMSRRAAEKEIIDGRVRINGLVAQLGDRVDPELDTVEYKGKIIPYRSGELTYIMLNKPVGCITTADDEKGRKNVVELVSSLGKRVYHFTPSIAYLFTTVCTVPAGNAASWGCYILHEAGSSPMRCV